MYQFIGVDQPREQYAELVRSREQQRIERRLARDGRRVRELQVPLIRRFLGRRRVARGRIVGRIVGA